MEKVIIAFVSGGIVAVFSGWLSHVFSEHRRRREDFNKAATEFRNAFVHELIFLRHNASIPGGERTYTTLNEFLQAGYIHRHLRAFEIFRDYLTTKERAGIDKAWKEYCHHPDTNILWFEQYSWKAANKVLAGKKTVPKLGRVESCLFCE
jgi:hypothetical protein